MAAFKDELNDEAVRSIASCVVAVHPRFDASGFAAVTIPGLAERELKARVGWIAEQLRAFLPADFGAAINVLIAALGPAGAKSGADAWGPKAPGTLSGFRAWPVAFFVGAYGTGHLVTSLDALEQITRRWTGEFAIRQFLLSDPEPTLARMHTWTQSEDQHLRRLASEGSRPRLPWGIRLGPFVQDPSAPLALLEALKDDPEEYVRRSVANNLNDISKDHPAIVLDVLERWTAEVGEARRRLVAHALRTLVKEGEPRALRLLGYSVPPRIEVVSFALEESSIALGQTLRASAELRSVGPADQMLAIDYAMDLVGANGKRREKIFKGSVRGLRGGETVTVRWKQPIAVITTRRYYNGPHGLELIVNGQRLERVGFELSGC